MKTGGIQINRYAEGIATLTSILVGLLVGFIILLISLPNAAIASMKTLLCGSYDLYSFSKTTSRILYNATPLIICGEAVTIAIKCGKLNLGGSGQYWAGGFAALAVVFYLYPLFGKNTWIVAIIAAMIAGGIVGAVPGLLNAYRNVNVIISCIMMNYLATYLVDFIFKNSTVMFDITYSQTFVVPYKEALIPKWGLDKLFPSAGSGANAGIIIAIIVGIILWFLINRTTLGFELRLCGTNPDAAKYAGVNAKHNIVLSMVIAGMLGGLAGGLFYISSTTNYLTLSDQVTGVGFSGLCVGLLGLYNPIGVIFAGIFMAYIKLGGNSLQIYGVTSELIDIVVGAIIYASSFTRFISSSIISKSASVNRDFMPATNAAGCVKKNKGGAGT